LKCSLRQSEGRRFPLRTQSLRNKQSFRLASNGSQTPPLRPDDGIGVDTGELISADMWSRDWQFPDLNELMRRLSFPLSCGICRPRSYASHTCIRRGNSSMAEPGPRYSPVPHRAVVSITGTEPNLSTYLNGLLATKVSPAEEKYKGFYSTFLNRYVGFILQILYRLW
jgi:hypothetical protein